MSRNPTEQGRANLAATPASSNGANTTAATDYAFTWSNGPVNHVMVQNNTSANVQWELDASTSNGSPILAPGATLLFDVALTTLHLLTAANQNVNGSSASNIVVKGWL